MPPPLPVPPPGTPPLVWLAQNPEVLPELIRLYNALRRLEVAIVQDSVTRRGTLQTSGTTAVIKVEL